MGKPRQMGRAGHPGSSRWCPSTTSGHPQPPQAISRALPSRAAGRTSHGGPPRFTVHFVQMEE